MGLLLLILWACGTTQSQSPEGPLRIGMRRPPDSLNPYLSMTVEGEYIAARLFPRLYREEPRLKDGIPELTPYLAAGHSWNAEGTVLSLSLKPDLHWQDGTPLTAEDVAYSFDLQKDPEVAWLSSGSKDRIEGWKVLSATEIEVTFKHASPMNLLDVNEGFIVPRHHFSKWPVAAWPERDWAQDLVVYGPYRIKSFDAERLLLTGVAAGAVPDAGFAFVREKETLFQLLLNHSLDFSWTLPVERIPEIEAKLAPAIYDDLTFAFIAWNPIQPEAFSQNKPGDVAALLALKRDAPHPLFADERVRKAMTFAMRREHYQRQFWYGRSSVPVSPWSSGLAYYKGQLEPRSYDPQEAERLLNEAGWLLEGTQRVKDGRPFRFSVISVAGSAIREQYLLAIQQDLRGLGIEMEVDVQEASRYVSNINGRQFDAVFGIFRAGTRPDLSSLFHSREALDSGANYASWTEADLLLDEVAQARTVADLSPALLALERLFFEQQPMTMLYKGQTVGASSSTVLKPRFNYLDPLFLLEQWNHAVH